MKRDRMEELQLPKGLRKLLRRLWRSGIIFHSLHLALIGCACAALIFNWGLTWVIASFVLSVVCKLTVLLHIGRRYVSAWKVAKNPQLVYWAHPLDGQGRAVDKPVSESKSIRVHLKDGTHVEVEAVRGTGTTQQQLQGVLSWLRQTNPTIRWGSYDSPGLPVANRPS